VQLQGVNCVFWVEIEVGLVCAVVVVVGGGGGGYVLIACA